MGQTDTVIINRRRVPRRMFETPVGILLKGQYTLDKSYQIGEGGMMLGSPTPLKVGVIVVLNFFLQNDLAPIIVRATIRNIVPAKGGLPERYGVEFANLGFQSKRLIRNFVAAATSEDGHIA